MKSICFYIFAFIVSFFSKEIFAQSFEKPYLFESEKGIKAYIIRYDSDDNAYLIKMSGTKTFLDDTVLEMIKKTDDDNDQVDSFFTTIYGFKQKFILMEKNKSSSKIGFVNPDNSQIIVLSYDKLDNESLKYNEKDMLLEYKNSNNKEKINIISKFNRTKAENYYNINSNIVSKNYGQYCKLPEQIPVSYIWNKVSDSDFDTWKTNLCLSAVMNVMDICQFGKENEIDTFKRNVSKIVCVPENDDVKKSYVEVVDKELIYHYTRTFRSDPYLVPDYLRKKYKIL